MDDLLQCACIAFRRQHGLVGDALGEPPAPTEGLLRQASRHRLVGLLAAELFPEWKSLAYGQAYYTTTCTAAAESIYTQLRNTIPLVGLIKGPALAVQAWAQPGLRNYDDLDFRCAFVRYGQLRDALAALGYAPGIARDAHNAHLWHFGWGVEFVHPEGPRIECNHRMFPPHYPWPARLNARAASHWQRQQLDQVAVNIPGPALHLLYCCMHALWHGWERLAWVIDIAGLLVAYPEAYADARAMAAAGTYVEKALDMGCAVAAQLVGPLPVFEALASSAERVQGSGFRVQAGTHSLNPEPLNPEPNGPQQLKEPHEKSSTRLVKQFSKRVLAGVSPASVEGAVEAIVQAPAGRHGAGQRQCHYGLMRPSERLQYDLKRLLIPGDPDFSCWPLPAACSRAYWLLRPGRLPFALLRRGALAFRAGRL